MMGCIAGATTIGPQSCFLPTELGHTDPMRKGCKDSVLNASAGVPLLRPVLPSAQELLPFLRRIDASGLYTNFGPLHAELLNQLLMQQSDRSSIEVHGVLTANATLGLELALQALDLPPHSKVALPALTFPATATAIQRCGHQPVVMDIDPCSWLLTPAQMPAGEALRGIAAVIPVASFGMPQDLRAWSAWQQRTGIPVVMDAAAAFGAQETCAGMTTVFSLHATKPLSCGEGGLIVTSDSNVAERLRCMTNFGIGSDAPVHSGNAKLSEYHAAVGLAHLQKWQEQCTQRMALWHKYREALSPLVGSVLQFQQDTGIVAPCVFPVQLATEDMRSALEDICVNSGIQTRRWYLPLIQHLPGLANRVELTPTPAADWLAKTLLGLPFFPTMASEQMMQVVSAVFALRRGSSAAQDFGTSVDCISS